MTSDDFLPDAKALIAAGRFGDAAEAFARTTAADRSSAKAQNGLGFAMLAQRLSTLDAILAENDRRRFVNWVKKQPVDRVARGSPPYSVLPLGIKWVPVRWISFMAHGVVFAMMRFGKVGRRGDRRRPRLNYTKNPIGAIRSSDQRLN